MKMNVKQIVKSLTAFILIVLTLNTVAHCQKSIDYIATFPGGVVYLPTINTNNVVIRYNNLTGGFREATFYPRGDTLLAQRLDSCKREYIALSWSYDALEQRYIDSTYSAKVKHEQMIADNAKQVRRVRRKSWFRGFLWGGVGGCLAMAWAARL